MVSTSYLGILITLTVTIASAAEKKEVLITGHPFYDDFGSQHADEVHGLDKKAKELISITFPGTKWCGPGDIANGYDDLGKFRETDMCCRDHDHCENIPSGGEKYGLRNDDWFTRLHCKCDKQFYQCLHAVNKTVSNVIGKQYFLFRDKCFQEAHPIVECVEYQTRIFVNRCIKYRFDTTKPKLYQWFDLPLYSIESYPDLNGKDVDYFYKLQQEHLNELTMNR